MKILDKNYTCQVITLPQVSPVEGLDNLVKVTIYGNPCLIGKDSKPGLYLFFPSETVINELFLMRNNLFRHSEKNEDPSQKGFFEDTRRVKALKFRGVVSTGFVIPVEALYKITGELGLKEGDEFNEIAGMTLCRKYKRYSAPQAAGSKKGKLIDEVVDSKMAPEHFDTEHLMKNTREFDPYDLITVSVKLHGTSARYFNTLVLKPLKWYEKLLQKLGINIPNTEYNYVAGSRKVIKSVGFEELPSKFHFYKCGDLWTDVGKEIFNGKLLQGESVYCEIIGTTYGGTPIQGGYTYGLTQPKVYIYRIGMINAQGIEIDLSPAQMKIRAEQLGVATCPEVFSGTMEEFLTLHGESTPLNGEDVAISLEHVFYDILLEKPSILDSSVVEEGFCVRKESYPKCKIYKVKSRIFLAGESKKNDTGGVDLEEDAQSDNNN